MLTEYNSFFLVIFWFISTYRMKSLEEAIKTELEEMDAQPVELDTLYMDNKAKSATVKVCYNQH